MCWKSEIYICSCHRSFLWIPEQRRVLAEKLCHGTISWEQEETRKRLSQLQSKTPWHRLSDSDRRVYLSLSPMPLREMVWLCLQQVSFHPHGLHPQPQELPRHPSQQHQGTLLWAGPLASHFTVPLYPLRPKLSLPFTPVSTGIDC